MVGSTATYRVWQRLSGRPGGSRLFSAAAVLRVPYFATIVPHVVAMEPGYAEVAVPKWFFVKDVELTSPSTPCRRAAAEIHPSAALYHLKHISH